MHDTPLNKLAAFNDSVSPDDIKLWKAACAVECDPSTDELVTLLKVCILSASNEACCRGREGCLTSPGSAHARSIELGVHHIQAALRSACNGALHACAKLVKIFKNC